MKKQVHRFHYQVAAGLDCMMVTPPSTGTIRETLVSDLALSMAEGL